VLAEDGYALLRGVLDREAILKARNVVIETLHQNWKMIDQKQPMDEAHIAPARKKGMLLTGYTPITHHHDVLSLLEGTQLVGFFTSLFRKHPATFSQKWVRVHGQEDVTDEHTDFFRFANGAKGMYTCWIPLGDYTPMQGTLAVCERSHLVSGYDIAYGVDTKVELPGGFEEFQADNNVWRSTTFNAGDIVVFDIRTVHASTKNTTRQFRISMDTRWQPVDCVALGNKHSFTSFNRSKPTRATDATSSSSSGNDNGSTDTESGASASTTIRDNKNADS
jgi:Phytanoyl-CoA dioxygenase (PhyH)